VLPDLRDVLASGDAPLLAGLLMIAAARGYRAPAPLLPALLDAAVREPALRSPVRAVLGERGRWLAGHREDWAGVAGRSEVAAGHRDVWETGLLEERRRYLEALRREDPDGARELLAGAWAREPGEAREAFLPVLATGLDARDEPFLDAALDDRKASVRATARTLLARLPDSGFARRAAARTQGLLRVERKALRLRIVVAQPDGADAAAVRDGIDPAGSAATLRQLLAAAPLAQWPRLLGADPVTLAGLPVDGGFAVEVHAGWRAAVVRQGDADWARALLAAGPGPSPNAQRDWPADRELAAVLPLPERLERVLALVRVEPFPHSTAAEIERLPAPWPGALARAVVEHLWRVSTGLGQRSPADSLLLDCAARSLPTSGDLDHAGALAAVAAVATPDTWAARLRSAADTVTLRRRFEEKIR